ncbi:MAG: hypothetical protein K2O54_05675 [Prevotella sp.]|nr:hypothetical protein [Prevotella sp.]
MANKDNSERIERYIREQMTPEENETFLNDLKNDKKLREEAQMMALLIKEMKEEQAKQDDAVTQAVLSAKKKVQTVKVVRWTLSIAAMFILIFSATIIWNRLADTDVLFNQYYTPYEISSSRGGDDEAIEKELAELYNKVGIEKNVTPIIDRLQTIYDNIQSNNEDYADYSYYEPDIAWYLALAYLKDNHFNKAKELLKPLVENGDGEAERLLKAIE